MGNKTSLTEEIQNISTPMNGQNAQEGKYGIKSIEDERSTTVKEEEGLYTPHFVEDDDVKFEPSSSTDQNEIGNIPSLQPND